MGSMSHRAAAMRTQWSARKAGIDFSGKVSILTQQSRPQSDQVTSVPLVPRREAMTPVAVPALAEVLHANYHNQTCAQGENQLENRRWRGTRSSLKSLLAFAQAYNLSRGDWRHFGNPFLSHYERLLADFQYAFNPVQIFRDPCPSPDPYNVQ